MYYIHIVVAYLPLPEHKYQWKKALELFQEFRHSGKEVSNKQKVIFYNAIISALEKSHQWEKAIELFEEMKEKNLSEYFTSY